MIHCDRNDCPFKRSSIHSYDTVVLFVLFIAMLRLRCNIGYCSCSQMLQYCSQMLQLIEKQNVYLSPTRNDAWRGETYLDLFGTKWLQNNMKYVAIKAV